MAIASDLEYLLQLGLRLWRIDFTRPLDEDDRERANILEANSFGSEIRTFDGDERHVVLLDIDYEARLIPSTTPGHYHLVLNHAVSTEDYAELLRVMAKVGLVQQGFADLSIKRGQAFLRLPGVKKNAGESESQ